MGWVEDRETENKKDLRKLKKRMIIIGIVVAVSLTIAFINLLKILR